MRSRAQRRYSMSIQPITFAVKSKFNSLIRMCMKKQNLGFRWLSDVGQHALILHVWAQGLNERIGPVLNSLLNSCSSLKLNILLFAFILAKIRNSSCCKDNAFCDSRAEQASTSILATRWHHHLGSVLCPPCSSTTALNTLPSSFTGHCPKRKIYRWKWVTKLQNTSCCNFRTCFVSLVRYILTVQKRKKVLHSVSDAASKCSKVEFIFFKTPFSLALSCSSSYHYHTISTVHKWSDHGTSWVSHLAVRTSGWTVLSTLVFGSCGHGDRFQASLTLCLLSQVGLSSCQPLRGLCTGFNGS